MSLATSTGGLGGGAASGGLTMAHQAVGPPAAAQPPPQHEAHFTAPPPSAAALGADLVDKQQGLTLRQVKNTSHLPLVAIDLHAESPHIALYPKKPEDTTKSTLPIVVGKMHSTVRFQANEGSHKTLRKWLSKSKTYASLQADTIAKVNDKKAVEIDKPHRWLGMRRLDDIPEFLRSQVKCETASSTHAIAEEASTDVGVVLSNSTLDGSTPKNDDFDRVVCKTRLVSSKKAVTVLPEEATEIILHQAQYHVAAKVGADKEDEEILDYPVAIAVPAWASHDAAVEALADATSNSGVFFQRSVCALAGAVLPGAEGKPNVLIQRINQVRQAMHKEFQRKQVEDPNATFEDDIMLLMFGMTPEGFECTAIQISNLQANNIACLFGNFKVLSNVSYQDSDPISKLEACSKDLEAALEAIAPEADGPAAIVTYGSSAEQEAIKSKWESIKSKQKEWKKVPLFVSKPEAVAKGTAVLGANSHGRIVNLVQSGKKHKAVMALQVQNVAPVAVGVQFNYYGGAASKWMPVKTIFDFDRRVPAGPYPIELKASECVVHRDKGSSLSEEEFLKATTAVEGAKGIPKREEAALNLKLQVVQKWTQDGDWKKVGDAMEPLVKRGDSEEERIACEAVTLELSLGVTGMISTALIGDRESVVQATKTARNSALRYYVGIVLAILFFGGFLVRSYWEGYVLERDTTRLLAYYKHVLPGSMHDGDTDTARYLAYKYRNKKDRLWKTLENKYGVPVKHAHEWEGEEENEEPEEVDLDKEGAQEESSSGDEKEEEESSSGEKKEEPDL